MHLASMTNLSIVPLWEGRASVREGGGMNHSAGTTDKPAACAGPNGARYFLCPLEMLTDRFSQNKALYCPLWENRPNKYTGLSDGLGVKDFPLG